MGLVANGEKKHHQFVYYARCVVGRLQIRPKHNELRIVHNRLSEVRSSRGQSWQPLDRPLIRPTDRPTHYMPISRSSYILTATLIPQISAAERQHRLAGMRGGGSGMVSDRVRGSGTIAFVLDVRLSVCLSDIGY